MSNHFSRFNSRRSTVYSTKGIVSSPQFLANSAGVKILELGGNCVDAAIAVSAALCITEPAQQGLGAIALRCILNRQMARLEKFLV